MKDGTKTWLIVIGFVVGACIAGWLLLSGGVSSDRASQLARARAAKAKKAKAARSTETETNND